MKYLIFFFFTGTILFSQKIEVNRIKFLINDSEFIWDLENSISGDLNPSGSEPEFIASFFKYKPGDKVELNKLEKEIDEYSLRLVESGLFYSQQISIVPPRKYPNKRTIVVKVSDGFKYRFGGGNAYGFFGNMNLYGRGDYLLLAGGLNKVLLDYRQNAPNKTFWGNKLFINPLENYGYNSIYVGYNISPDISFIVDFKGNFKEVIYPSGGISINLKKNIILGDHRINYQLENSFTPYYNLSLDTRYIPPIPISLQTKFNWDVSNADLFLGSYFYYHFKTITQPPFNIKLSPYIFVEAINPRMGVGLEIYFDVPIFTIFSLSYGWDLDGNGSFEFR